MNVMRSYSALVATVLVASILISKAEARFGRINTYLVEKVTSDDVSANMEAASKWLEEQVGAKQSILSTTPVSDLKKFTALQQVINDVQCHRAAYEILRENMDAVGLSDLIRDRQVIRRVDKVILKIYQDHARRCAKVFLEMYRTKRSSLNKEMFELAKTIAKTVMEADRFMLSMEESYSFYHPIDMFYRYIRYYPNLKSFARQTVLLDALRSNAKNDPDSKYTRAVPDERTGKAVVHKDKLRELTKKYLIEPCQYLDKELGPDLFVPARFDLQAYSDIGNEEGYYYLGWSYYMICQALTRNERAVYDNVIKSVTN